MIAVYRILEKRIKNFDLSELSRLRRSMRYNKPLTGFVDC